MEPDVKITNRLRRAAKERCEVWQSDRGEQSQKVANLHN